MTQIITGTVKETVSVYQGEKGDKVGKLVAGDKIAASENRAQWLHLSQINESDVSAKDWWTTAGGQGQYIDWRWETVGVGTDPTIPPGGTIPGGPDVRVTRVEGTVDGVPFIWRP